MPAFVELKHMFRDAATSLGERLSSRDQHRFAQTFLLRSATDEEYAEGFADPTGETAVKNVLIEYIRLHGSLRAA